MAERGAKSGRNQVAALLACLLDKEHRPRRHLRHVPYPTANQLPHASRHISTAYRRAAGQHLRQRPCSPQQLGRRRTCQGGRGKTTFATSLSGSRVSAQSRWWSGTWLPRLRGGRGDRVIAMAICAPLMCDLIVRKQTDVRQLGLTPPLVMTSTEPCTCWVTTFLQSSLCDFPYHKVIDCKSMQ